MGHIKKLKKIYEKEDTLLLKQKKLDKKLDTLTVKKNKVAYILYKEFITNNINNFHIGEKYYYLHIERNSCFTVEELILIKENDTFLEFRHFSQYRQNQIVTMYLENKEKDYQHSSVVIDNNQYLQLSREFNLNIRK